MDATGDHSPTEEQVTKSVIDVTTEVKQNVDDLVESESETNVAVVKPKHKIQMDVEHTPESVSADIPNGSNQKVADDSKTEDAGDVKKDGNIEEEMKSKSSNIHNGRSQHDADATKTADADDKKKAETTIDKTQNISELKTPLSEEQSAELKAKVSKQIEYYFSDINLTRDKFLLGLIEQDNGWVTMETMLKFNRLRQLTTDSDLIVSALRNSTNDLVEVSEDGLKIRRSQSHALPENTKQRRDEILARTLYVKKFPQNSTLDELKDYFEENHGVIEQIFLRTYGPKDDKKFKGSVFVTFLKKDDADKMVKAENIRYKDSTEDLICLYKQKYFDNKNFEREEKKKSSQKATNDKNQSKKAETQVETKITMVPGAVLHLTGLTPDLHLNHVKLFFNDISPVQWVDIDTSKKEAWVRFQSGAAQSSANAAKEANEGKLEINNIELEARVLEGEEEIKFWDNLEKELTKRRNNMNKGGGRGGKKNQKGQRGQWQGRRTRANKHKKFSQSGSEGEDDGSPPEKQAKVESKE